MDAFGVCESSLMFAGLFWPSHDSLGLWASCGVPRSFLARWVSLGLLVSVGFLSFSGPPWAFLVFFGLPCNSLGSPGSPQSLLGLPGAPDLGAFNLPGHLLDFLGLPGSLRVSLGLAGCP